MLYWPVLFIIHALLGAMISLAVPVDLYQVRSLSSMDHNALVSRSTGFHMQIARSDGVCDIQRRCTQEDELDAPEKQKPVITKHTLEKRSKAGDFFRKIGHGIKVGFQKVGHWLKDNWQKVVEVGAKVVGTIAKAA